MVLAAASTKGPWQGAALKASGSAPHEAHGTFATWRAAASPEPVASMPPGRVSSQNGYREQLIIRLD